MPPSPDSESKMPCLTISTGFEAIFTLFILYSFFFFYIKDDMRELWAYACIKSQQKDDKGCCDPDQGLTMGLISG